MKLYVKDSSLFYQVCKNMKCCQREPYCIIPEFLSVTNLIYAEVSVNKPHGVKMAGFLLMVWSMGFREIYPTHSWRFRYEVQR